MLLIWWSCVLISRSLKLCVTWSVVSKICIKWIQSAQRVRCDFLSLVLHQVSKSATKFCLLSILSQQLTRHTLRSSTPVRGVLALPFNDLNKSLCDDRIGLPGRMKTIEPEEWLLVCCKRALATCIALLNVSCNIGWGCEILIWVVVYVGNLLIHYQHLSCFISTLAR